MENKTKERKSNIELLRIILMFSIILHHLVYHNYLIFISGPNNRIATILGAGAKIAVNCFILIMGYFAMDSKWNIKKVINLALETIFYSILFMFIFERDINKKTIIDNLYQYWFVIGYLITYALSPLIKTAIRKTPSYIQVIIFMLSLMILLKNRRAPNIYIPWFLFVYVYGIYTKKYAKNIFDFNILNLLVVIILFIFSTIRYKGLEMVDITSLICAQFLLLLFVNLEIKQNKVINYIAKYTIGIYLIHDNVNIRNQIIIRSLFIKEMYTTNYFAIYTVIIAILIYASCLGIDILRNWLFDRLLFKNGIKEKTYD